MHQDLDDAAKLRLGNHLTRTHNSMGSSLFKITWAQFKHFDPTEVILTTEDSKRELTLHHLGLFTLLHANIDHVFVIPYRIYDSNVI